MIAKFYDSRCSGLGTAAFVTFSLVDARLASRYHGATPLGNTGSVFVARGAGRVCAGTLLPADSRLVLSGGSRSDR